MQKCNVDKNTSPPWLTFSVAEFKNSIHIEAKPANRLPGEQERAKSADERETEEFGERQARGGAGRGGGACRHVSVHPWCFIPLTLSLPVQLLLFLGVSN